MRHQVLLVSDSNSEIPRLVRDALALDDVSIANASSAKEGLDVFRNIRPQVVLLDSSIPGIQECGMLESMIGLEAETEVIILTDHLSANSKLRAIHTDVYDGISKPLNIKRLRRRIFKFLSDTDLRHNTNRLDRELLNICQFEGIVGRSLRMLDVFAKIRRVAPHFRTVLVSGDTGTGKELVAHALHRLSPASSNPFVTVNCSAIVESLMESELFGHMKGAFTGAFQNKIGVFEFANSGSVFLDEVGELPLTAQAKLLRVLQNREIQRVGSPVPRSVEVRVIAATSRVLLSMVSWCDFREMLCHCL